jgi:hypothetical protein
MDRRGWIREAAVALLVVLALAIVSTPASAADFRGSGSHARTSGWVSAKLTAGQGDGLLTRFGSWLVQMAKVLVGQTDGEGTDASAGLDPTHSGEASTDPTPSVAELPSGS